jgi:hypothetical protein
MPPFCSCQSSIPFVRWPCGDALTLGPVLLNCGTEVASTPQTAAKAARRVDVQNITSMVETLGRRNYHSQARRLVTRSPHKPRLTGQTRALFYPPGATLSRALDSTPSPAFSLTSSQTHRCTITTQRLASPHLPSPRKNEVLPYCLHSQLLASQHAVLSQVLGLWGATRVLLWISRLHRDLDPVVVMLARDPGIRMATVRVGLWIGLSKRPGIVSRHLPPVGSVSTVPGSALNHPQNRSPPAPPVG